MKVIFLDIDGVLIAIGKGLLRKGRHQKRKGGLLTDFDEYLVLNLKHLLKVTGAKIVISSSWRYNMERTKTYFLEAGLDWNLVIGKTPNGLGYGRGNEILHWIFDYIEGPMIYGNIEKWIVIDDDSADMKSINRLGRFIHTKHFDGLTINKMKESINLLN